MIGSIIQGVGTGLSALTNIGLGVSNLKAQRDMADQNARLQREFAQNSIQWRVSDARKAGIHPLYALGANGASYTPQSYDGSAYDSISRGVSDLGKSAYNAYATYEAGKTQKLQNELLQTQIDSQKLQNEALQKQLSTPAGQRSNQMEAVNNPVLANVPAGVSKGSKVSQANRLPYGVDSVDSDVSLNKMPSNDVYGQVGILPSEKNKDWYSEGILNQFQWHFRNSNPFRNPFTEKMIATFANDLANAGVDISKIDVIQEFSFGNGWTMRAVPKGVPANFKEKLVGKFGSYITDIENKLKSYRR